jgi:hypothetical protein
MGLATTAAREREEVCNKIGFSLDVLSRKAVVMVDEDAGELPGRKEVGLVG